ncbi:DNA circulation family protein [Pandoraea captiosa]|uniref:DNA circulation family protein n=1 Tax=Pandoraea captiosa TaxID=2508302 RepID=A0A5E4ZEF2_9BURK|nr:DNA circularization N-terminal domain-containing protein [Pandoraea captiosa]VVE59761.1 DNA circulation family protein [Pandoraea captiosa]
MAWKDTLQDAAYRGVKFDCLRASDSIEKDVARYAYPNVDGEDIVDMGLKARETTMTAVFFGDDYEERMKAFLSALAERGAAELIHPVFGSMPNMQFLGGHVGHDADNPDACTVELRFAPSTPSNPFFVEQKAGQKADATAQVANGAKESGASAFETALGALKDAKAGIRRINALRDVLSNTLGPIKNLVTGFQGTALDLLNFPRAFTSDLIGLVSGITDFRSFDPGMVMSDWGGMFDQMSSVVKLPGAAAKGQSITIPGTDVASSTVPSAPGAPGLPSPPSQPYAPSLPSVVAANASDVQLVTSVVKTVVATTVAEVASDVLANEVDEPVLTPDEIEKITNDTRELIQDAIDETHAALPLDQSRPVVEALKDTALAVQELAKTVIDARPPIMTRTVDAPCNLALLAFRWYGDYTRSAELLRLNPAVRNPNFIAQGEVLRGFAR